MNRISEMNDHINLFFFNFLNVILFILYNIDNYNMCVQILLFLSFEGLLCACTNSGFIVIWRVSGEGFEAWQQVASTKVKQNILKAAWGINQLAVNTSGTVYVLKEQPLSAAYHDGVINICSIYESIICIFICVLFFS